MHYGGYEIQEFTSKATCGAAVGCSTQLKVGTSHGKPEVTALGTPGGTASDPPHDTSDAPIRGIVVKDIRDFDPVHTFECGQCFRWNGEADGSYTGVACDKVINVALSGSDLIITNTNFEDFKNIWYEYFDLGTDYSGIKAKVAVDATMKKAVSYGSGIRLLRQDFGEALISFIISANNNIPRIKKIVEALCSRLGNELKFRGRSYYTFPQLCCIADAGYDEVAACRGGYRTEYICNTTKKLGDCGLSRDYLQGLDTDAAGKELLRLSGVGPKVADCVLLFSGIKFDVFPTDVWIKKVMERLYLKREATQKEIQKFALSFFGKYSGYAQQYLFYYARENEI